LVPKGAEYELRWFTPKIEVDLCGHATLAAAKFLAFRKYLDDGQRVTFSTRSGNLDVVCQGDRLEMDFPREPQEAASIPPGLFEALGVHGQYVGRNRFDFLVEVDSETDVRAMTPDFRRLATIACRGIIVTARSDASQYDFVSRFFAPAAGIDEDPVTGSAHCCLADFWSSRLQKPKLVGYQASSRGGVVLMECLGARVLLAGKAFVVAEGSLMVS
jgi:PhzF family phenazine biosynthesis protein